MLQDFFDQLPAMHTGVSDAENCLGSAMQAAMQLVVSGMLFFVYVVFFVIFQYFTSGYVDRQNAY